MPVSQLVFQVFEQHPAGAGALLLWIRGCRRLGRVFATRLAGMDGSERGTEPSDSGRLERTGGAIVIIGSPD